MESKHDGVCGVDDDDKRKKKKSECVQMKKKRQIDGACIVFCCRVLWGDGLAWGDGGTGVVC